MAQESRTDDEWTTISVRKATREKFSERSKKYRNQDTYLAHLMELDEKLEGIKG